MYVIATAGHVDHGKSTLVRALTGMEPDRLAEERRRGLTLDLGNAWTELADGVTAAFVDVPGHQRFIGTMLAGVGPVPAVMFVVAADGGWCAQSDEHLAVIDALGVRHGLLVISRADLGDACWAKENARQALSGTSLEGIETVVVSAVDGTGVAAVRVALGEMLGRLPEHPGGRARLWIDRVFTIDGAGTVVTGTLSSGVVSADTELEPHPTREIVRVRSLHSLNASVDVVQAVSRVAINLRGVRRSRIRRGDVLTEPGAWLATDCVDVRINPPCRLPTAMTLHLGSARLGVRVRPLGSAHARLAMQRPLPCAVGDRGVLRDPGSRQVVP